jgi:sulfate adenylyltransferase subunit 1
MLRITTCGSVDDGKSTLIGRLLMDCAAVPTDQMQAVVETSRRMGHEQVDLALLTDGLRAEREQGITIDVAYRYFDSPSRRIIIADAPGHEQYTRNMATAASVADLAIVLIDARAGVITQTRRHTLIAALLRVPQVVFAVNKCDLVGYNRAIIEGIGRDARAIAQALGIVDARVTPISALLGENVARPSAHMPWYDGPPLLELLDAAQPGRVVPADLRFPVQHVIRPRSDAHHDYRGYAGTIASGVLRPGDRVLALPSGLQSRVRDVHLGPRNLDQALAGQSVAVTLETDIDVPRGEMLVHADAPHESRPVVADTLEADLFWMDAKALEPGARLLLKHTTRQVKAIVEAVHHRVDLETWEGVPADRLNLNDVGRCTLRLAQPVVCDTYQRSRPTGSLVLISDQTGNTLAGGMIVSASSADA